MKVTACRTKGLAASGRVICLPIELVGCIEAVLAVAAGGRHRTYKVELEDDEEYVRFYRPYEPYCVVYVSFVEDVCYIGTGR